ncbi:S41 family peptidase [Massilia sp. TN1-12]|uniref:S41 family peptidase n=1 Tax=Massilia paldalensis TaxID=3377675 RepID=UPI00384FDCAE
MTSLSAPFARAAGLAVSLVVATSMLSACGGGGGDPTRFTSDTGANSGATTPVTPTNPTTPTTPTTPAATPDPIPADFMSYQNLCAVPRTGVDTYGTPFPDRQGTMQDEMKFLRGWADRYYLWYDEIPATVRMADYTNVLDYFGALKTPAVTASGKPKDRFHFTYTTAEWDAMNTAGEEVGYGLTWSTSSSKAPRTWLAAIVEPGSPAAQAGLQRGDMLTAVDGTDFVNTSSREGVDKLNAGLFPAGAGERHTLTVQRSGNTIAVTMDAAVVASSSVKNTKVIDTPTGRVGYLTFDDHNAVAEKQLIDAFTQLKAQNVSDLVIDMRYNGGGLLYIASELAYMVAGPASNGQTFERLSYNDKTAPEAPIPFRNTAYGFPAPNPAPAGQALPYLGLKHVTVLATADTCSASEAVINGLRGIDVQVDVIGGQTCGKPYGFTPVDNCGTTYFSIEFAGVNAKGFGDFADGFAPTCMVADDLSRAVGDPAEGMLAAALAYRASGTCPTSRAKMVAMKLARPQAKEIAVLPRR